MNPVDRLASLYVEEHPTAAAMVLQRLPTAEAAVFVGGCPPLAAGAALITLDPSDAAGMLVGGPSSDAAPILSAIPAPAACAILRRFPPGDRSSVLGVLPERNRRALARLLTFREGTAGTLADPDIATVQRDRSVDDARKRSHRGHPGVPYVYVTEPGHRLVGVVSKRQIAQAPSHQSVRAIMQTPVERVLAQIDALDLMSHVGWTRFDSLPVVDGEGVLIGVIQHRSLRNSLRAKPAASMPASGLGALVSLGEVYWTGLAKTLAAFGGAGAELTATGSTRFGEGI